MARNKLWSVMLTFHCSLFCCCWIGFGLLFFFFPFLNFYFNVESKSPLYNNYLAKTSVESLIPLLFNVYHKVRTMASHVLKQYTMVSELLQDGFEEFYLVAFSLSYCTQKKRFSKNRIVMLIIFLCIDA